jgi:hypothetical protein
VRLRRRSDGVVVPAVGRRARGRSAYLCPSRTCFEKATRRRALERALGRLRPSGVGGESPPGGLLPAVAAALDHELQNMQRTGDQSQTSPRYDALLELRRGLGEPGRSA